MDPFPLQVGGPASLPVRLAVGAVAGLLATAVMTVPMKRLPEGTTPTFVAAGALTGEALTEVSERLAAIVHYVVGTLAGVLFAFVAVAFENVIPTSVTIPRVEIGAIAHLLAGLLIFGFLAAVFGYLVLPVFGGEAAERADRVRNDWTVAAAVYTVAVMVFVPVLMLLV